MPTGEKFSVKKYQSDANGVYSIRVSADAAALSTTAIGAYTDKRVRVTASNAGNSRKAGLHARGLRLGKPAVAPATGYTATTFVPILSPTDIADLKEGQDITYQGDQWEILKVIQET